MKELYPDASFTFEDIVADDAKAPTSKISKYIQNRSTTPLKGTADLGLTGKTGRFHNSKGSKDFSINLSMSKAKLPTKASADSFQKLRNASILKSMNMSTDFSEVNISSNTRRGVQSVHKSMAILR